MCSLGWRRFDFPSGFHRSLATNGKIDATGMVTVIKDIILRLGLDGEKLPGQCYDGCSTMMVAATHIKKDIQLLALSKHCYAHSLNFFILRIPPYCKYRAFTFSYNLIYTYIYIYILYIFIYLYIYISIYTYIYLYTYIYIYIHTYIF